MTSLGLSISTGARVGSLLTSRGDIRGCRSSSSGSASGGSGGRGGKSGDSIGWLLVSVYPLGGGGGAQPMGESVARLGGEGSPASITDVMCSGSSTEVCL